MDDMMNENSKSQYEQDVQNNPYGQYDPNMQNNPYGQYQYYQQPYPQNSYAAPTVGARNDGWAIASLVFGILSILTCCCFGIPGIVMGIVAIVLAFISRHENGSRMPSMAIAGMICGIIGILLSISFIAMMLLGEAADI